METSRDSQLAEWKPERFHIDASDGSYDMLRLKCANCKQTFWVAGNWAKWAPPVINGKAWSYRTRPCPYCFVPSWLPDTKPSVDQPLPGLAGGPKKRRVVRRNTPRK
jgi:hypothetical protein